MRLTNGVLELPGVSIYYETYGAGPLLVLIPGLTGTGDVFTDLAGFLSSHYTVVTYDRRGFSRDTIKSEKESDDDERSPERVFPVHAQDLAALIRHLSPQDPSLLFATSIGAIIALQMLQLHSHLVRGILLHDPVAPSFFRRSEMLTFAKAHSELVDLLAKSGPRATTRAILQMVMVAEEIRLVWASRNMEAKRAKTLEQIDCFFAHEAEAVLKCKVDAQWLQETKATLHLARGVLSAPGITMWPAFNLAKLLNRPVSSLPGGHMGYITDPEPFAHGILRLLHAERASL